MAFADERIRRRFAARVRRSVCSTPPPPRGTSEYLKHPDRLGRRSPVGSTPHVRSYYAFSAHAAPERPALAGTPGRVGHHTGATVPRSATAAPPAHADRKLSLGMRGA